MKRFISLLLILCASLPLLQAQELTLGPLFTDHMVLQQGQPLPVWGTAPAGRKVSVTFGKTTVKATADKEGKWQVTLPRQAATFEGKPLAVSAGKEQLQLHDVVVGEVWVAAGQSNMEYTMKKYPAYQNPYKGNDLAAEELQKPENRNIRVYNCPRKGKGSAWQCANAESLAPASAPGYFCVKHLQDSLQVPMGLITNAIGGTAIESWLKGSNWYTPMVAPYVPFAVRGFLWYQGETNVPQGDDRYVTNFMQMTREWREAFLSPDAPFLTVMLAPHIYSDRKHRRGLCTAESLPRMRMLQLACLDSVANTEIIFNPDLVDDLTDIHHSYKWEVGRRLAVLALNKTYGRTQLEWSGPRADSVTVVADKKQDLLRVHFTHVAAGLYKQPKEQERQSGGMIRWFEVAGEDGIWHSALAYVEDAAHVVVWSTAVKHPVQVRYLWHETAQSTDLRNSLGLCAFPFCLKVKTAGRPTIYSIGDSTMSNRKAGTNEAGWGQMLPEHLTDAIRVDNHAQAGRSTKSFISEGRWQAVLNLLQPGDYVFIQFGHNDEKEDEARHTEPMTTFKDNLRRFITEAQDKGATPVLFNAMVRRKFGPDGKLQNTHGDYIRAPFEVAEEMAIPYVDAEQLSRQLVEQLGPEDSKQLFMWYPPKKKDDTHLNRKGALQMSKLFLDAAAEVVPELKAYIK